MNPKSIWVLTLLLILGCTPRPTVHIVSLTDDIHGGTTDDRDIFDAPPDRFVPDPIPVKKRDHTRPRLNLRDMPPLTLRMQECYGRERPREEHPIRPLSIPGQPHPSVVRTQKATAGRAPGMDSAGMSDATDSRPRPAAAPESAQKSVDAAVMSESLAAEPVHIAVDDRDPVAPTHRDAYEEWGAAIYLSNDDSMSLSSAQRVIFAIDNFLPLPAAHIRPHELLNYFSFDTTEVQTGHDFSVLADISSDDRQDDIYALALSVAGRPVTRHNRRNAVVTWVLDRSGSMHAEGRMAYLKQGLLRSLRELKSGDMVHLVLFDHNVCTPVENFVVGRDSIADLEAAIRALEPRGATDIHLGLATGYQLADRSYQGHHSNRVILVSDALTNTGVTDSETIAMISRYYDSRRIRLSAIGVGRDFNDELLDRLTERGKGAYLFLGSDAEVDSVFGPKFISLIETTAMDVHFRLHLPISLRMNVFYGEESSVYKEDVQAIHYFANTRQLFLSDLIARGGQLRPQDDVMLSIEYEDPETGDKLLEQYAFNLGEIQSQNAFNVVKGRLLMTWIDMLSVMAQRSLPQNFRHRESSWMDDEAHALCEEGREELNRQTERIPESDPEIQRVLQLWDKFCMRYERPRQPVKRDTLRKRTPGWPGLTPEPRR